MAIVKRRKKFYFVVYLSRDSNTGKENRYWSEGFDTKKQARSEERKFRTKLEQYDKHGFLIGEKADLNALLDEWFEEHCEMNLKTTTVEGYKSHVSNHVAATLGTMKLAKIKPMHLHKFYNELKRSGRKDGKGGLSPTTIVQIHRILHKCFKYGVLMEYIIRNPADAVEPPKKEIYEPKTADFTEISKYIEVFLGTDYFIPVVLAFELGLRRGEALGLGWEHANLDEGFVDVQRNLVRVKGGYEFTTPKTKNSRRRIKLSEQLIVMLKAHKTEQNYKKELLGLDYVDYDLVCCRANGEPIKPDVMTKAWRRILNKNGIVAIRFHDARHTNGKLLTYYDTHIRMTQDRLGHSDISTTAHYTQTSLEKQNDVAKTLSDVIYSGVLKSRFDGS